MHAHAAESVAYGYRMSPADLATACRAGAAALAASGDAVEAVTAAIRVLEVGAPGQHEQATTRNECKLGQAGHAAGKRVNPPTQAGSCPAPRLIHSAAPQPSSMALIHPGCPPQASSHCNAGNGSNLSFRGLVECDASVMAGDGAFGAVAAAPGGAAPYCRLATAQPCRPTSTEIVPSRVPAAQHACLVTPG